MALATYSAGLLSLLRALTPWRERGAQRTKRTGWLRFGIEGTESIADHMYRMVRSALWCEYSGRLTYALCDSL